MTNRTKWTEYTGSDEQIAEISSSKNGFVCRNNETDSGVLTIKYGQLTWTEFTPEKWEALNKCTGYQ